MSEIKEKNTRYDMNYNLSELYSLEELKKLFKFVPELYNLFKQKTISNLSQNSKIKQSFNDVSNNINIINYQTKINKFYFIKIILTKLKSYFEINESFIIMKTISLLFNEIENIEKYFICNLQYSKKNNKMGQKIDLKLDKKNKSLKKSGVIKNLNYINMTRNQDKLIKNNRLNNSYYNLVKNVNNRNDDIYKKKIYFTYIDNNNYKDKIQTEINSFNSKIIDNNSKIKRINIDLNEKKRNIQNTNLSLRELKKCEFEKILKKQKTSSHKGSRILVDSNNTQISNLSTNLDILNSYRKTNKNIKNKSDIFNYKSNLYIDIYEKKKNNSNLSEQIYTKVTKKQSNEVKTKQEKNINKTNLNISLLTNIETKDFDIFELDKKTPNTLTLIGYYVFNRFGFHNIIKYPMFENWCKKITEGYNRKNPYHNDLHAADITQTCLTFFKIGKINEICKLNQFSKCSLFLSCICHDFKHPGVNNIFLKETKNILAIKYNDNSILENMHISEAFKLTIDYPDCDIFSGMTPEKYKQMRKEMISCVLTTDMDNHKKTIGFMEKIVNKKNTNNNNNINEEKDKDFHQEYMNLLIHSADISNPTKKFDIYSKWAKVVLEEFFQQGDKEKELGIKCSFDRETMTIYKNQLGFINYIEIPFYSLFVEIFPKLKFLLENINNNKNKVIELEEKDNNHNNKQINNKDKN